MSYYNSFDYPKFEIKTSDNNEKSLYIVDYIRDAGYGHSNILGKDNRKNSSLDSSPKYTALTCLLDRLISNNWNVTIVSNEKRIFMKTNREKYFTQKLIVSGSNHSQGYEFSDVGLQGDTMDITLTHGVGRHLEWTANIDINSITEIKAEYAPFKLKDMEKPSSLGTIDITPDEGKGQFKVILDVMDHRVLKGIAEYDDHRRYKQTPELAVEISGYRTHSYNQHNYIHVVKGIKGLAIAMRMTDTVVDNAFPPKLSQVFYAGLESTYMFRMKGKSIDLISQDDLINSMDISDSAQSS